MSLLQMSVTGGVMILVNYGPPCAGDEPCAEKDVPGALGRGAAAAGAAGLAVLYPEHLFTAGAEDSLERGRRARSGNCRPFRCRDRLSPPCRR